AEALGPNRVLPDAKAPSVVAAAAAINSGLSTTTSKGSNIIGVSYTNRKPEVTTQVLSELVTRYFTKHLEVHRSAGAFDFVSQQASNKDIGDYQALVTNLTKLRETQPEMSAKYTPENVLVKMNQAHINDQENQKRNLEKRFPELASLQATRASEQMDIRVERARLAGMKSKLDDL